MQLGKKNMARICDSSNTMHTVSVLRIFNVTLLYVNTIFYRNRKFSSKSPVKKYNADDISAFFFFLLFCKEEHFNTKS